MTQILEQAWNKVIRLPEERQELIAYIILEELKEETLWDKQFSKTQTQLKSIAQKVRKDIKEGKILQKGFGEL